MKAALLSIAMTCCLSAFAGKNDGVVPTATTTANSAALQRSLDHQLNKHVTFPLLDRTHDMTGTVEVSFVINTEGKVEVLAYSSDNLELQAYVLKKLGKVDIGTNPSGTWRTSHIRFVFRPEA